ncbi:MAG: efflux RND transporter permease subunit [Blautia sp.]|nr:efflux RND transporter permease subunit [Blautia sp.]
MDKVGKWIAKHKILIIIISFALLIPSYFGMAATRINYDVLSYLPESLETVKGQDIMVDEFGIGAFSMIVVEDTDLKDVAALKQKIEGVDHVEKVLWYDSVLDLSVPVEMLPKDLREAFFKGDATMMIALFDNTTSSDSSMDAVTQIRKITAQNCFISGMTGIVTDIKQLALHEMPIYVVIAGICSLIVLLLAMDSLVVPLLFLLSIGMAVIYNLGTNIFLGEISYITKALTAVLQLGVTMDYSIFLLNSYEENKNKYPDDRETAMAHAIAATFKSVIGSSITTVAGFFALCFMTFALGRDMGIVMAKGVLIGVVCCVTFLPAMVLTFDKAIEKTKHKPLIPSLDKASAFITKHYKVWLIVFLVMLFPAIYGNSHLQNYYNIDRSLPQTLDSNVANKKLQDTFDMSNIHMILLKKGMTSQEKGEMLDQIKDVDGVRWALGMDSFVGPAFPDTMIPEDVKNMLESDQYELQFVCSRYKTATEEVNKQIDEIQKIVKKYSPGSMVIGEAPLTKDLEDVTEVDLKTVNIVSILAIFIIIMIVFKSISLPFILVAVIEFAIFVNMAVPFYQGKEVVFVASIVIGCIQLGATVDYAILMTNRYQTERYNGKNKKEAIANAHKSCMKSVIISGCSFFAATFGVGMYTQVDMIGSITNLLSRGAIISTVVVLFVLPAMFMIFDPLICHTSIGFIKKKDKKKA